MIDPLNRRLGRLQSRYRRTGEKKNIFPPGTRSTDPRLSSSYPGHSTTSLSRLRFTLCMHINFYTMYFYPDGPGSVVGIATAYGLDGPGIESRLGEIFRTSPDRP